jgi:hypothetical protein
LTGSEADRWLEVPAWMFDRATCPDSLPLMEAPFASFNALAALSALLDLALKDRSASSNAPLSGSCKASRDQNRGEAHVMHDGDVRERIPARSTAAGAADGSVQEPDGAIGAPAWPELPLEARAALTSLMTQLILDHAGKTATPPARETGHDL